MKRFILSLVLIAQFAMICPSKAALEIDVTQGQIAPTPIAIPDFMAGDGDDELSRNITSVVVKDLEHSGLFRLVSKASYIQDASSAFKEPRFQDWRMINAQCLLVGRVTSSGGKITVDFRLFDIFNGTEMLGMSLSATPAQFRKIAHMISDAIYSRVTGEAGYFDTKMTYIDMSGPRGKKRVKRLAIMDYDGHNNVYLTDGVHMVLTPQFSPSTKQIAYFAYVNKSAHVYMININDRKKKLVGQFKGMTFAPRFSPDGSSLVMSLTKDGTSALYKMDLGAGGAVSRLTQHSCIDTSPCFSPDGSQIVFTSDRSSPETCQERIYVMDKDGGNVRCISSGDGRYSEPTWSPRGDLIAFTKRTGGRFYIGVMNVDGTNERLVAEGEYLVEAPSWAPNGRVILFTKQTRGGASRLYTVDLTGRNLQPVKTARDSSDGAWSRLLSE